MSWLHRNHQKSPLLAWDYLGVFALAAAIFGYINASPTFLDPDSFYHVKMAELLVRDGIVRDFTWLPYTTLAHNFADHHFLYHALLVPFLAFYGAFVGAKIATVTLAAAAVTAFYGMLKSYAVRWPFAFTMLLATSSAFIFRANLTKTSAISVAVLMLALIAIRREKALALFLLSWFYVWTYGGWPIMVLVVGAFLASRAIADRLLEKHPLHSWGHTFFWRRLLKLRRNAVADFLAVREVRLGASVAGGLLCGLIINPYFPSNVLFYWEQIVQIAVINYRTVIGVGAEWYPYDVVNLFSESSGLFLVAAELLVLQLAMSLWPTLVKHRTRTSRESLSALAASFVLAVVFVFLTMRSRRHVEYFTPFAIFAVALAFTSIDQRIDWQRVATRLRDLLPARWARRIKLDAVLFVYLVAVLLFIGARNVHLVAKTYRGGIPWTRYERVAAWMRVNLPEGAIIAHSDRDQFPPLFYRDDSHRYICGLDPTFLYRQDPTRYWLWVDLTTGRLAGNVAEKTRDGLGARYFFVGAKYEAMRSLLERNANVVLLYHDEEADVYGLR